MHLTPLSDGSGAAQHAPGSPTGGSSIQIGPSVLHMSAAQDAMQPTAPSDGPGAAQHALGLATGGGSSSQIGSASLPPSAASGFTSTTAACKCNAVLATLSDDERVKIACERIAGSVFSVKFVTKETSRVREHIKALIKDPVFTGDRKEWEMRMKEELRNVSHSTTGFVVAENQDSMFILTCAHSFQLCFDESRPMTKALVDDLYDISVCCDHLEAHHRLNKHMPRVYAKAAVLSVDSSKDMLLLEVQKGCCTENHAPLELAQSVPVPLGLVGMVSWPFDRYRTKCKGHISHHSREFDDMGIGNPHGYDFTGVEVNISAEAGSSGAPLVDLDSKVTGLLHGGRVECFTYFVSLADLHANLTKWGIIRGRGSKEPQAAAGGSSIKEPQAAAGGSSIKKPQAAAGGSSRKKQKHSS